MCFDIVQGQKRMQNTAAVSHPVPVAQALHDEEAIEWLWVASSGVSTAMKHALLHVFHHQRQNRLGGSLSGFNEKPASVVKFGFFELEMP